MARTKFPTSVNPGTLSSIGNSFSSSLGVPANFGTKVGITDELGVAGAKISHGYVYDEFLPQLQGESGRKIYREMRDNDATVNAILFAIEMLIRAADWNVKYDERDDSGLIDITPFGQVQRILQANNRAIQNPDQAVEFMEGILFEDMSHTWDDFIAQTLSMLEYGWQYSEIVFKLRKGPDQREDKFRSDFSDGLIGIRKLADRSQQTLERWVIDERGNLFGMIQSSPYGGGQYYIPMERALLFRPKPNKDSPEGRSILRGAYRSYYFLKNIQEIEAIAIERELNGFPVVYIPNAILTGTDPASRTAKAEYIKMARDIKFNEQGGAVLPSDPFVDEEGNPTNIRQVELQLLSSNGQRQIDADKTIRRYQTDIARTVLAGFLMLDSGAGSFARSKNETNVFVRGIEGWLENIAAVINRELIPKIWKMNMLDPTLQPYVQPGRVDPENLEELGRYINDLSSAGIGLFDEETANYLRSVAGLPDQPRGGLELEFDNDIEDEDEVKPVGRSQRRKKKEVEE